MSLEFLAEGNVCGQTLLRLVSRGSALIAELQRLSDNIPRALRGDNADPDAVKYLPILYDFRYLKTPEMFDRQINTSVELGEVDTEFYAAHEAVLTRFYNVFCSILKYIQDLQTYTQELDEGFFMAHTLEGVLLDMDGKQLMCEAVYLQVGAIC
jgi:WASH complex subunit strumpellin